MMDIKGGYLHSMVEEEIYMHQPDGFNDGSGQVLKLQQHFMDSSNQEGLGISTYMGYYLALDSSKVWLMNASISGKIRIQ